MSTAEDYDAYDPIPEPLHGNTLHSSRDVLWAALDRARDLYTGPEWDRICTAMARIAEACEMELDAESEDE